MLIKLPKGCIDAGFGGGNSFEYLMCSAITAHRVLPRAELSTELKSNDFGKR
ncbi:hypothetical protein [Paenibacillus foliorum]|uniref:hypothetical protein n=1 Tax=Paenibacillus foliorum TaxID=2654974 RepID=UPI001490DCB5|nr:hypothetical protein [Paenibacillus foliorum]